jgi:CheY-like chemotaxis protein
MSEQRKILVVDDDPVVSESFNRVLSRKGYAVITAANGDEALAKMKAEQYDLVFTDLRMPGMDGLEVAEQVKARQPWTPVVIVTGYGSKPSEDRARAIGVADFLNKPLSPETIEDSAAKALASVPVAEAPPPQVAPPPAAAVAPATKPNVLKNMVLFLLAPFVGLLYAVLLPFVGLGMLAWLALKKKDQPAAPRPE